MKHLATKLKCWFFGHKWHNHVCVHCGHYYWL